MSKRCASRAAVALAFACALVFARRRAEAAETLASYPPDLARPPVDGLGFLFVEGARLAPPGTLSLVSSIAGVKRLPTQVSPTTGGGFTELALRDGWSVTAAIGYVVWNRLALFPSVLVHTEGGLTSSTETTLDAKWQLVGPSPVGAALRTSVGCGFSWGSCDPQFASWFVSELGGVEKNGGVRGALAIGTALRGLDRVPLSANALVAGQSVPRLDFTYLDASRRSALLVGTAVAVTIARHVEAILEVRAFHLLTSRALGGEGNVGLRVAASPGMSFSLGVGPRFADHSVPTPEGSNMLRGADVRAFANIELSVGTRPVPKVTSPSADAATDLEPSDVDHDGITDAQDRCPWESAPEYIDGCPRHKG